MKISVLLSIFLFLLAILLFFFAFRPHKSYPQNGLDSLSKFCYSDSRTKRTNLS